MPLLNTAQSATLRAFIQADPVYSLLPVTANSAETIANDMALNASPDFFVWRTTTPVSDIQDAVIWANFTPANPTAAVDLLTGQNVLNWILACQGKQFNLQLLLSTTSFSSQGVATGRANIRSGLQDCLSSIPSGSAGATRSGGWNAVQLVIQRKANKLEKLFSTGTGSSASPASMAVDGRLSWQETLSIMTGEQ